MDPDAPSQPLRISGTVDGRVAALTNLVAVARPDVAAAKHSGPTQGYAFDTAIEVNGLHTVCVNAANLGAGAPVRINCATVQIGPPPLTPAQIAAHSPSGALEAAGAVDANNLRVRGWASDPDNLGYPLTVQAYVDGIAHSPVQATLPRPDLAGNDKAGAKSGYRLHPVGAGRRAQRLPVGHQHRHRRQPIARLPDAGHPGGGGADRSGCRHRRR